MNKTTKQIYQMTDKEFHASKPLGTAKDARTMTGKEFRVAVEALKFPRPRLEKNLKSALDMTPSEFQAVKRKFGI